MALPFFNHRKKNMSIVHQPAPVLLEVLAFIPTDFFHCSHCERLFDAAGMSVHEGIQESYPPDILEDTSRLAAWLQDLSTTYEEQLHIQVFDPQSLQGFFKSLRYWVRQYPTFIIDRQTKYTGWEADSLESLLANNLPHDTGG